MPFAHATHGAEPVAAEKPPAQRQGMKTIVSACILMSACMLMTRDEGYIECIYLCVCAILSAYLGVFALY